MAEQATTHQGEYGTLPIVLPAVSDDRVSRDLVDLTERLSKVPGVEIAGGFLGGEFGYGASFENDTFTMFPYYWGDCECGHEAADAEWSNSHDHAPECYQQVIRDRGFLGYETDIQIPFAEREARNRPIIAAVCAEMGLDPEYRAWVHCTCTHDADYAAWVEANPHALTCGVARPNFLHKASGTTVRWYKYIGRDMEADVRADWPSVIEECRASIAEPSIRPGLEGSDG